ncbi:hypothetical protein ADN00_04230 [Ornatilinea apprima]|uniref:DUF4380 domain-containing protein n=1 Tax=Ornatilinea apprima TaxID=1134406 RepID=A0A0P6XH17_9CHLR|nr:hypothetical protein [Ornatilinea apprima]KPL79084.1 hypothetical protein ADN00_04230 [Ornatilinea apprima]
MQHLKDIFAGYPCLALTNGLLTLHVMQNAGPRIIGLQAAEGPNLMAEVPLAGEQPNEFIPRGGQRLWHAPEDLRRTYIADNEPVSFAFNAESVLVTQNIEKETGIQKSMEISMPTGRAEVRVKYGLQNHNLWPVTFAAWPIAQMRMGGFAILPQSARATGLLPNRRLVIWPYTDIQSENIVLGNRYIFVQARYQGEQKAKIGWLNDRGWMGYYLDNTLIIKQARFEPQGQYVDMGCNMECYCDRRFLEMETLSPLTSVQPGGTLEYEEKWLVFSNLNVSMSEESIEEVIRDLNIE